MQDQASKKVVQQLNVETDDCDTRQGNKVGSSAVGELNHIKDNFIILPFTEGSKIISLIRDMVKYFESTPSNRKNMIWSCRNTEISRRTHLKDI